MGRRRHPDVSCFSGQSVGAGRGRFGIRPSWAVASMPATVPVLDALTRCRFPIKTNVR